MKIKTMRIGRPTNKRFVLLTMAFLAFAHAHPAFAIPLPGLPPAEFGTNFDAAGGNGELQFNDVTGEILMNPTTVSQIFRDDREIFIDPFIGVNVQGFGRFVGDSNLFPDIEITEFTLTFLDGTDPVLTFESGSHFPRFADGSMTEAFDLGIIRATKVSEVMGSIFLEQFPVGESLWFGGMSYIKDGDAVIKTDAVVSFQVPEPPINIIIFLGLVGILLVQPAEERRAIGLK